MRLETLTFHAPEKVNFGSGDLKVSKGRSESPLVASAEAKSLRNK